MASAIPVLSGREVVRAFEKFGWRVARQKASHIILVKAGEIVTLSVLTIKKLPAERCAAWFAQPT